MSMIGNFLRVTNEELDEYLDDSSKLDHRLDEEFDKEEFNLVDIDKSWEGILFLLTGKNSEELDHPLSKVLFSGQLIDEEQDLGYGPGHYLRPNQVKELYHEISKLSAEGLREKYDPAEMEKIEIYPGGWTENGGDLLDYLLGYFEKVKEVYKLASTNNEALITFLN